jgi:hypothetical protein
VIALERRKQRNPKTARGFTMQELEFLRIGEKEARIRQG